MNAFVAAWDHLLTHPLFTHQHRDVLKNPLFTHADISLFQEGLEVHVCLVDPATNLESEDESKNTKALVGLEVCVAVEDKSCPRGFYLAHDMSLDLWGDSFEDAIIALSALVRDRETTPDQAVG